MTHQCDQIEKELAAAQARAVRAVMELDKLRLSKTSHNIIKAILADMTDRRGLRQAWDDVDDDIQKEIEDAWVELVRKGLE